jgi:chromosome condensin MukBEF MukE localization factor
MERTPGSIDYGSDRDCDMLLTRLSGRLKALEEAESGAEFAAEVRRRTQVLSARARYERRGDTVPVPESLDGADDSADLDEPDVNVLAEEFWHVTDVLLS